MRIVHEDHLKKCLNNSIQQHFLKINLNISVLYICGVKNIIQTLKVVCSRSVHMCTNPYTLNLVHHNMVL